MSKQESVKAFHQPKKEKREKKSLSQGEKKKARVNSKK